jgi:hypothetical protein
MYLSSPRTCHTLYVSLFPPYVPHAFPLSSYFINTNNVEWRDLLRQFFQAPVISSLLDQNIFLITPFSNTFNRCSSVNTEGQVSHPYATWGVIIVLSSKGYPNKMFKTAIWWQKTKPCEQKSTISNCNSTFTLFSVFNTQTVRHVLKTLAIFSVHLRQMHYVLQESITSAILQHFTSITCQHSSPIVNNWPVYWREGYLKKCKVHIFLGSKYLYSVILLLIYIFHME